MVANKKVPDPNNREASNVVGPVKPRQDTSSPSSLVLDVFLFALTAALYINSLNGQFVYDDIVTIQENKVWKILLIRWF